MLNSALAINMKQLSLAVDISILNTHSLYLQVVNLYYSNYKSILLITSLNLLV